MAISKSKLLTMAAIAVAAFALFAFIGDAEEDSAATINDYSDDPILWIYGNSDGDHDIDADDVAVIKAVIAAGGTVLKYPWCDANADLVIDQEDVDFVQSMIDGTATELFYLNIDDKICSFTVRDHMNILSVNQCNLQTINVLMNKDKQSKVVAGDSQINKYNRVFNLNFTDSKDPAKGVLVTGQKNGEVDDEIVLTLEKYYGHVEITLGSQNRYGQQLEDSFGDDENISIVRLPSWESNTLEGLMTYGYLFGGVQKSSFWTQALAYYDWYMKYYGIIEEEVAKIPEADRPHILTMYVKDCFDGATNQVLSTTSGDYERSELCGGNNVGDFFGTGYVNVTAEDMAACEAKKGIDIIYVEPSGVYGDGGKEYVTKSVQLCIDEFKGYISEETKIYSLSFMVTTAAPVVVGYVCWAQTMFPDNAKFAKWNVDDVFEEYLAMSGWTDRTDISDIVSYGPGYAKESSSSGSNTMLYIVIAIVAIIVIAGVAYFFTHKKP